MGNFTLMTKLNAMKISKLLFLFVLSSGIFISCSKDQDDVIDDGAITDPNNLDVESFIYKGMNNIYLYKEEVPQLEDTYFSSEEDLNTFLKKFDTPEDLFYNGLVWDYSVQDKFSFMTDDYIALEKRFQGTSKTSGMNYGLAYYPNDASKILGYIRYVLPNTSAADKGLERGMIFNKIDGQQMTLNNYTTLLSPDNFTIHLAELDENDNVNDLDQTVALTQTEYTANPVFVTKTLDANGIKVGYLMYNSFIKDFDEELNSAFGDFLAEGIDELILDLRYNGGGSVETAVDLSSMITGQYEGDIFSKQQWNTSYQAYFEEKYPENLVDRFNTKISTGAAINSLNLEKVYIIAGPSSASASELVINGLDAYIDVIHVGGNTVGKFQASVTLYDASDFSKAKANPDHKYAIQPLVYKSANAIGTSDYVDGLEPDVRIKEYVSEYGPLGDPNEPLLAAALAHISGNKIQISSSGILSRSLDESGSREPEFQKMYIENTPPILPKEE